MLSRRQRRRPTIVDVASLAGVSTATVSRVVNGNGPYSAATAEKVMAAVHQLNFTPHTAAKTLASNKTNTIGLLLPEISGSFFTPLLRGIEAGAREAGYGLLIYSMKDRNSALRPGRHPLGEHNADGLIVFTDNLGDSEIRRFYQLNFPLILLHRSPPVGLNIPCVTFENKGGVHQLMDHLIEDHAYRRIAFLTGPAGNEDSYWRHEGYREALQAHGIAYDPALVRAGDFREEGARAPVQHWLDHGEEIDAIFAADDHMASGSIQTLATANVRVPQDVAVVGFDDIPTSRYLAPPLTTVRAPIEDAGREATRQLTRLIQSGKADPLLLLPTEVIIRRSCGCNQA